MPIEFGPDFAPTWAGRPPGISPEDLVIWRKWQPKILGLYDRINFNVRLIHPVPLPPGTEPKIQKMADFNAARRIDVLGWGPTTIDIIELRAHAGLSAIGHLIGYMTIALTLRDWPKPLRMILVTDSISADIIPAVRAMSITIIQV